MPIRSEASRPPPRRGPSFGVLDGSRTWEALGRRPPHWRQALRAMLHELRDAGRWLSAGSAGCW